VRRAFRSLQRLGDGLAEVRQGLVTADDFRFVRLAWEVAPFCGWAPFAKGGEYAPFYADIHLVVNWGEGGAELLSFGRGRIQNQDFYFRPGITWSVRTASGFSPRVLPEGCIFSHTGDLVWVRGREACLALLGVLTSRVVAHMLEMMVASGDAVASGTAARSYEVGVVQSLPVPEIPGDQVAPMARRVTAIWESWLRADRESETSRYFAGGRPPATDCVQSAAARSYAAAEDRCLYLVDETLELQRMVVELYGLDDSALGEIVDEFGPHPGELPDEPLTADEAAQLRVAFEGSLEDLIAGLVVRSGGSRAVTKKCYFADRFIELLCALLGKHPRAIVGARRVKVDVPLGYVRSEAQSLVSEALGTAFGRWDVRCATGERQPAELPDPFDALLACPPGMLQNEGGLPATATPEDYPIAIDWDGILVDDPSHADDVIAKVREVVAAIWGERAEAIEQEACGILGVKALRDYFRKTGAGGLWDDHVKRYSKSRRKAPIYWYLRSARGNYGLWLYYHRLDRDLLYKAVVNYAEPKLRLEESSLTRLHAQREAVGTAGAEAKKLERELDKQEALVLEVRDLRDKLQRAAELGLDPDLNDGVVLNIAPLWELVPWSMAKQYWEELLEGRYEWSSIGKQLRTKGLVAEQDEG
jgi:hypothetical protein